MNKKKSDNGCQNEQRLEVFGKRTVKGNGNVNEILKSKRKFQKVKEGDRSIYGILGLFWKP